MLRHGAAEPRKNKQPEATNPGAKTERRSSLAATITASGTDQVYGIQFARQCYPIINAPYLGDLTGWLLKLFGLLVSGVAAAQGAPFWFDILKKVVNIRSSGASPSGNTPAAG